MEPPFWGYDVFSGKVVGPVQRVRANWTEPPKTCFFCNDTERDETLHINSRVTCGCCVAVHASCWYRLGDGECPECNTIVDGLSPFRRWSSLFFWVPVFVGYILLCLLLSPVYIVGTVIWSVVSFVARLTARFVLFFFAEIVLFLVFVAVFSVLVAVFMPVIHVNVVDKNSLPTRLLGNHSFPVARALGFGVELSKHGESISLVSIDIFYEKPPASFCLLSFAAALVQCEEAGDGACVNAAYEALRKNACGVYVETNSHWAWRTTFAERKRFYTRAARIAQEYNDDVY